MKSYILNYKEVPITYYTNQNKDKETLLFLHAAFSSSKAFEEQFEYFKDNYNIILIDMPGHGETGPNKKRINFKSIEDIIHQILKQENVSSVHIIGVSLGSLVAQSFAYKYPDKVSSVVVIGGYSIHKDYQKVLKEQKKEQRRWMPAMLFSFNNKFKKNVVTQAAYTQEGIDKFLQSMSDFKFSTFMTMDGANSFFVDVQTPVRYPTLVMYGEHENEIALEAGKTFEAKEPNAEVVYVEGAGHCINLDQNDKFNIILGDWLKKHSEI
ncbi:alpha/beta fold hydrolase [Breznakia pachnodae]|uniref:Pimeloyl-ACP methyl ester carboxylesterase n=1 Tax=Breznakia pachnodae TaxID=265178 RepID=A0ABU0E250_9FIRM|nr:alpha/beta hydrolase [Breznakia pachnodae]MDQ0360967.1 pimeloyl-ACP methyl ester carboxylesterase [Breznakia pachnodae]